MARASNWPRIAFGLLCILSLLIVIADGQDTHNRRTRTNPGCVECVVNGQKFKGHSRFQYEKDCLRYRCICKCDGSFDCPAHLTEKTCDDEPTTDSDPAFEFKPLVINIDGSDARNTEGDNTRSTEDRRDTIDNRRKPTEGRVTIDTVRRRQPDNRRRNPDDENRRTPDVDNRRRNPNTDRRAPTDDTRTNEDPRRTSEGRRRYRPNTCQTCLVGGVERPGNKYFEYEEGCTSYKYCVCRCDGSWSCPPRFSTKTCTDEPVQPTQRPPITTPFPRVVRPVTRRPSECRTCDVEGQTFQGGRSFRVQIGCISYSNCMCSCDGSWNCPPRFANRVCTDRPVLPTQRPPFTTSSPRRPSECRTCDVEGQTFQGGRPFQVNIGCISYSNCMCGCDGSWKCPPRFAKRTCTDRPMLTQRPPITTPFPRVVRPITRRPSECRTCDVEGQAFQGGRPFQVNIGCISYSNCMCNCDGSWNCPPRYAQRICTDRPMPTQRPPITTPFPRVVRPITIRPSECRTCDVEGQQFQGGRPFRVQLGCLLYSGCMCRCDGTWICPPNSAVNTCEREDRRRTGGSEITATDAPGCKMCFAYGKYFKSERFFRVLDGCTQHKKCICRCDGSWSCDSRYSKNVCTVRGNSTVVDRNPDDRRVRERGRGSDQCSHCNANGLRVKGNSYFEMKDGCIEYSNCLCKCDGSWNCPAQYAKNVCETSASRPSCSNCVAGGKVIPTNSKFDFTSGCIQYTGCDCRCDGSWECYGDKARNVCRANTTELQPRRRDQCFECKSKDGRMHHPNAPFTFVDACIEYNCDCFCNGSWNCPASRSKWACTDKCNTCNIDGRIVNNGTIFKHSTGCLEYTCSCHCNGSWSCPGDTAINTCPIGVNNNCNQCQVSDNEVYEGETDFVLRQGCLHYQCRCNCDGSYKCPGKEARNVCRGERLGGCRSCVVSDTEIYRGESDFRLTKDCNHFECHCNCDGSWDCPAEKTRDICIGEVPGGCRVCKVDNQVFRGNFPFDFQRGCIHYKCHCNCDGSWNCPGKDARDTCKLEIPGGCRSCILSENEFYKGNSDFEMTKNCIHYKCRCNCDGGYTCPGSTARRVCDAGSENFEPRCAKCIISEQEQYSGNSTFFLDRKCLRFKCNCKCDGSWECPAEDTRDTCMNQDAPSVREIAKRVECKPCKVGANVFPGDSSFKFTRRCYQYNCECNCRGRWSCDHRNPVNICELEKERLKKLSIIVDWNDIYNQEDFSAPTAASAPARTQPNTGRSFTETDIKSVNYTEPATTTPSRTVDVDNTVGSGKSMGPGGNKTTSMDNKNDTLTNMDKDDDANNSTKPTDGKTSTPNEGNESSTADKDTMGKKNGTTMNKEKKEGMDKMKVDNVNSNTVNKGMSNGNKEMNTTSPKSNTKDNNDNDEGMKDKDMDEMDSTDGDNEDDMDNTNTDTDGDEEDIEEDNDTNDADNDEDGNDDGGDDTDTNDNEMNEDKGNKDDKKADMKKEDTDNKNKKRKCQKCQLGKNRYLKAGTWFRFKKKCKAFNKCRCFCNGTWKCKDIQDTC